MLSILKRLFAYVPPFEPQTEAEQRMFDAGHEAALWLKPYDPPVRPGRQRESYDAGFKAGESAFNAW